MTKLIEVEGIGESYAAKLEVAGVSTIEQLLEKGAAKKGREILCEKSGVSETLLLKWVNRADLARIKGIGSEFADLLETAGVDSVPELAQRKPDNLLTKLTEVNNEKKLTRRLPTANDVESWIEQAKSLPRIVTH
ncbi:MAG: DUF4332 domain-containing protein [Armatimonadota bacterium]